jgi:hypothetical protein
LKRALDEVDLIAELDPRFVSARPLSDGAEDGARDTP